MTKMWTVQKTRLQIDDNVQKDNIMDVTNKADIENERVEKLEENPNINILGVAMIEEKKPQQSSQLSSTMSSEIVLSEFDETVEHPSQNGSESSSSGNSSHSDENDEKQGESSQNGAITKNKPDLRLKPKLITISKPVSTPRKRIHTKPRHTYAKPTCRQSSRAKKQPSNYLPDTDDSSIESENDTKDGDFIPEGITGKYVLKLISIYL